jgi:hypothetical protein
VLSLIAALPTAHKGNALHWFESFTAKKACSWGCIRYGKPVTVCSHRWRWFGAGVATQPSRPHGEPASDCVPVSAQKTGGVRGGVRFANAGQPASSARLRSTPKHVPTHASARLSAASVRFGISPTRGTSRRLVSWCQATCANSKRRGEERGRRNRLATRTRPWPIGSGTKCAASSPYSTGVTIGHVSTAGPASQCAGARSTARLGVA